VKALANSAPRLVAHNAVRSTTPQTGMGALVMPEEVLAAESRPQALVYQQSPPVQNEP